MASAIAQKAAVACTASAKRQQPRASAKAFVGAPVQRKQGFYGRSIVQSSSKQQVQQGRTQALRVYAVRDGATLDRPLRVAVIGGGPSGACAAESLAKGGVEAFLIERKMDNCKVRALLAAPRTSRELGSQYLPLAHGPSSNGELI